MATTATALSIQVKRQLHKVGGTLPMIRVQVLILPTDMP